MYYAFLGCAVTVFVGCVISCFTGFKENELYDEKLIHPIARKVASWCPGAKRRYALKSEMSSNKPSCTSLSTQVDKKNLSTSNSQVFPVEHMEVYNTKL